MFPTDASLAFTATVFVARRLGTGVCGCRLHCGHRSLSRAYTSLRRLSLSGVSVNRIPTPSSRFQVFVQWNSSQIGFSFPRICVPQ
ncbi:unnamed protein product [Cuscuta campestris]|uniref:Uncharacterized protein n=1 Tax=Cuscuta campestris TaxID=132261 RepID=A0A484NCL3_9ASTE|nr:unnamed protein product [Cuscuta campestris]